MFFLQKESGTNIKLIAQKVNRLILATKIHKGAQRKTEYPNLPNEKFLGVQNPFYKKGFGRRRQLKLR
jgi:hypothetical protein